MKFKRLTARFWVSPQLNVADIAGAAAAGVRTIISSRPDGEEPNQPAAGRLAELAARHGVEFVHVPVELATIGDADIARMTEVIEHHDGPVLAYCRSGTRAAALWALTRSGRDDPDAILKTAADAGYDLEQIRARLVTGASAVRPGSDDV